MFINCIDVLRFSQDSLRFLQISLGSHRFPQIPSDSLRKLLKYFYFILIVGEMLPGGEDGLVNCVDVLIFSQILSDSLRFFQIFSGNSSSGFTLFLVVVRSYQEERTTGHIGKLR